MTVTVLLFAAHREIIGSSRLDLDLPPGATVADLYDHLEAAAPSIGALRRSTAFAVNRTVVPAATGLASGDEVALLQPVSGGAA